MSAFQYTAINDKGKESKGIIEADSLRHARTLLKEKSLHPLAVSPIKQSTTAKSSSKLNANELSLITRQLATLITASIPLDEALNGVSEQTDKPKARAILLGVRAKVLEGYSLAQALSEFPHAFPEIYCATVASGEQTGKLDVILQKLADYTEAQQGIKQKVQNALIYPSIMILVSIGIVSFLLAFVVPKIIEVFTSSHQTLPIATLAMITISSFIQNKGLYVLAIVIIGIVAFKFSLRNPNVKEKWHRLLLRLPLIAFMVKTTNVSRYIHTFGILFASGVNVLETMRVGAEVVNNVVIKASFDEAHTKVREGANISQALKETQYLNPMAIHLIASGEKSGQLAEMMEKTANHMDAEVQRLINTGLTLLEPMVILIMGGIVMFIVLATLLPIFSMEQLVS